MKVLYLGLHVLSLDSVVNNIPVVPGLCLCICHSLLPFCFLTICEKHLRWLNLRIYLLPIETE